MFLPAYFGLAEGIGEVAVCCPFEHHTGTGVPYYETNPSAHVNTNEGLFHCKVCNVGYNELQFIQEIADCSYPDALKIKRVFDNAVNPEMWQQTKQLTQASKDFAHSLGITDEVLEELDVNSPIGVVGPSLKIPVTMFGEIVDTRTYIPDHKPKVTSMSGATSGLIIPFDLWQTTNTNRVTLVCAGEKDMLVARSHGFNAITITGGERALPKFLNCFKNRSIVILYDNDEAGKLGAEALAQHLWLYAKHVKVITNFHEVCKEKGEDLTDFFVKYGKTREDLIKCIEDTPYYKFTPVVVEKQKKTFETMSLLEASKPNNVNKSVQSNIQVVAVSDTTFISPTHLTATKTRAVNEKDTMLPGDYKEWKLEEKNAQDILHLVDNNFKEDTINKNIRALMKIPLIERSVSFKAFAKKTIFKVFVTDMFETTDTSVQPMEYTAYCIGCKLESGKRYLVTHKIVPHPYKGQQLTMIITDAIDANDSVSEFKVTEKVQENLKIIQNLPGSVPDKINTLTNKVKGLLGYNGNDTLIQAIDLSYNTALQFDFGSFKNVRGYLDTIVIGESRVGKSSTADTLRKIYGLGVFTSLAGNSATVPGLIGGSNKTAGGFQTRAGIIPQNHKGLIIFEEFGKSNANIIKELTDIRSSNEVRITRVAGTITLPALVRMIALTNVKSVNGMIKPIASYPNGFSILTELVETAEDIARYDLIIILSDKGAEEIDPFWEPDEPLPEEVYRDRIRWIWSRTPEQIPISKEVGLYITQQANELNKTYPCHIKLFGTEAWKKIVRLAIAVAGYVVSTDETFEKILVTKEHVDYAVEFFKRIYDNDTFKLKEYVQHELQYTTIDDEGVAALQDLYTKHPSLIMELEQCAGATKNMLSAATGLTNDDLNKALNRLSRGLFIRFSNHEIMPTERFRKGLARINKNTIVRRIGEDVTT